MANQRMYLRCNSCGAEKFIAKRLGEAFHTVHREDPDGDWDKWFEVHEWGSCGPGAAGMDIFSLVYEHRQEQVLDPDKPGKKNLSQNTDYGKEKMAEFISNSPPESQFALIHLNQQPEHLGFTSVGFATTGQVDITKAVGYAHQTLSPTRTKLAQKEMKETTKC